MGSAAQTQFSVFSKVSLGTSHDNPAAEAEVTTEPLHLFQDVLKSDQYVKSFMVDCVIR